MKNKTNIKALIEGSSLLEKSSEAGQYTKNLIEGLGFLEKKDLFYVRYPLSCLFRKSLLKLKQHNIKPKRTFLPGGLDLYHDASMSFAMNSTKPIKRISTLRGLTVLSSEGLTDEHLRSIKRAHLMALLPLQDAVIVSSERDRQILQQEFNEPHSKIRLIEQGIEPYFAPANSYEISLIKARYSIAGRYILFCGDLDEKNNIKRLLEAYSALKYESPPLLVLAGETGYLMESLSRSLSLLGIERTVKQLKQVKRKELPALLSGADFLVCPAVDAGFALPVLEALSCGCPVVASRDTAAEETALDCCVSVPANDPEKLADAIRALMSDEKLRTSLSQKGLLRAKEFSVTKMASKTLQLYREVLER
ncbi:MAG: glycosyltransferase family 1 protein [Candidatus Margulisiibacteriota bacterium]